MRRAVASSAAALFIAIVLAGCRQTEALRRGPGGPPVTVKIGALLPLSGKKAPMGIQQQWAFELAEEKLNAEDGIKVEFFFEDTKGNAEVGEAGARRLIEQQGVSIVFAFPCAIVYKTQPIADKARALLMACNLDPRTAQASPRTFRIFPNLRQQTPVMLKHLGKGNGKRAAVIRLKAPAPDCAVAELVPALKAEGWQMVANAAYDMKNRNYGAAVAQVKAGNPDVLFMYVDKGAVPPLLTLIRQAPSLGKTKIVGGLGFVSLFKLPPQMLEGVIVVAPVCALSDRPKLQASWMGKEFRKRHGKPPHMFAAFCFDGAMLVGRALKEKGSSAAAVQAYLKTVKNYAGVTGSLTLDEAGDAGVTWGVGVYKNGKLVPIIEKE